MGRFTSFQLTKFSLITIPLSMAGLPLAIYVAPLYTDHVGLGLTTVGLALLGCRLLDVIIDPLIGRFSDRTNHTAGRRIPWMMLGVPIMMVGAWFVFNPPEYTTGITLFLWLCVLYLGWALITVPYGAWAAEMSNDYHERSRITGYREVWTIIGLLLTVTIPLFVHGDNVDALVEQAAGDEQELAKIETQAIANDVSVLGWAIIILLPITALLLLTLSKSMRNAEAPQPVSAKVPTIEFFRNKPFLLLFAATLFANVSIGMNQTTVVHYYRHRAGLLEWADVMIFVFFFSAIIGAGFWTWIGGRANKSHVIAAASFMNFVFLVGIVFVPYGNVAGFVIVQLGTGFAYAGPLILGASMAADVIDLDWLRNGFQRGGLFIAIWELGRKLSEAAGVGIALPLMEAMGFDPNSGYTDLSQTALVTANVVVPAIFALLAIPFLLAYPLDEKKQKTIRVALERKLGRQGARDIRHIEEAEMSRAFTDH